jgi:hypothetical protein
MELKKEIEVFLKAHSMSATAFGMQALNDPPFVAQLRGGRDIRMSTVDKCRQFMAKYKGKQ